MGLKDFTGRLSGRTVEEKLAQYSEVYGEVLLGMHRDLEQFRGAVTEHNKNIGAALGHIADVDANVTRKSEGLNLALVQAREYSERASRSCETGWRPIAGCSQRLEG